mgnify:CR=1 FL=1
MRGPLHTFFLVLIICLVQFFTVATLKILDAGADDDALGGGWEVAHGCPVLMDGD